jgi:hypothetical protein
MAYFTTFESIIDLWHIANSNTLLSYSILWYHQISTHIDMTRLKHAHSTQVYYPNIYHRIELIVKTWSTCKKTELPVPGYSHSQPQNYFSLNGLKRQWILLYHGPL